jgi:predicted ATP-binding protein involved in virulence
MRFSHDLPAMRGKIAISNPLPNHAAMRIDTLTLKNFRRFDKLEINFRPQFNLLVGKNGSGKTTILDGLSVAMGAWLLGMSKYNKDCKARSIGREEARLKCIQYAKAGKKLVRYEYQHPVMVKAEGEVTGKRLVWERTLEGQSGRTTSTGAARIKSLAQSAGATAMYGKTSVTLPLISYYGTGRIWQQPRDLKAKLESSNTKASKSRMKGYLDSHAPRSDAKSLFRWIQTQQYIALQEGAAPELDAVKKAILGCIEDGKRIYFSVNLADLILEVEGQERQPFNNLSDGYQNMIAMVGDIAWKAVQLNPHLGTKAPAETPGIVLIDELDLHLHPSWQRRVIEDLRRTFPKIQFICTTHSPFLIQGARAGEVIGLDKGNVVDVVSEDYVGASLEDIVEEVQRTPQPQTSLASKRLADATEKYALALRANGKGDKLQLARAEREFREAEAAYGGEPGLRAMLKLEALAAEVEASKK